METQQRRKPRQQDIFWKAYLLGRGLRYFAKRTAQDLSLNAINDRWEWQVRDVSLFIKIIYILKKKLGFMISDGISPTHISSFHWFAFLSFWPGVSHTWFSAEQTRFCSAGLETSCHRRILSRRRYWSTLYDNSSEELSPRAPSSPAWQVVEGYSMNFKLTELI